MRTLSVFGFFGLFVLLSFSNPATAEQCLQDWACWEVRRQDDRYEFWVTNKRPYIFTASLEVGARNLRSEAGEQSSFKAVGVLPGNSEKLLLTLYPTKSHREARYWDLFFWTPGDLNAVHDDDYLYTAPFAPGETYPLVQGFGGGWSHSGASKYAVDFAMPIGTAVHAARAGIVVQVVSHNDKNGMDRSFAKYANYVMVLHEDGTTGEYYHLKKDGVEVEVDQVVKAGDLLGYSGNTGFSSLPHLHFAVYRPRPMGNFESIPFEFKAGLETRRNWFDRWW